MLPLVSNASLRALLLLMLWEHLHGRCIWLCLRLLRRLSCWLLWRLCWRLLGHLPRGHLLQLLLRLGLLRLLLQLQLRLQNGLLLFAAAAAFAAFAAAAAAAASGFEATVVSHYWEMMQVLWWLVWQTLAQEEQSVPLAG